MLCASCGLQVPESALSCPSCHALVHAAELERLSVEARSATAGGDLPAARAAWDHVLRLLPPDSIQFTTVHRTIADLAARMSAPPSPQDQAEHPMRKRLGTLGAAGAAAWKFKTFLLLVAAKGKFLLFGLTKLSTLMSMLLSMGVYWALYGWKFAAGFVFSIYIHEMGHVAALSRYGIAATAPMFIPGLGAFIRAKAYPANPSEDARVGLAGPIWGLGAALFCLGLYLTTGAPLWGALARVGAWINLFNLIPVWQLDGGRGFHALTRQQRGMVLGVALLCWLLTSESMLLLIALGAGYRLFTKDYPEHPDNIALFQFAGLLGALSAVGFIATR